MKEDDNWLIASAHETIDVIPAPAAHLQELAWLVGQWEGEKPASAATTIKSACDWTANHSFLIRKFSSAGKDGAIPGRHRSDRLGSAERPDSLLGLRLDRRLRRKHLAPRRQTVDHPAYGNHGRRRPCRGHLRRNAGGRQHALACSRGTERSMVEREPDGPAITLKRGTSQKPAPKQPRSTPGLPTAPATMHRGCCCWLVPAVQRARLGKPTVAPIQQLRFFRPLCYGPFFLPAGSAENSYWRAWPRTCPVARNCSISRPVVMMPSGLAVLRG